MRKVKIIFTKTFLTGWMKGLVVEDFITYPEEQKARRLAEFQRDEESKRALTSVTNQVYTISNIRSEIVHGW